MKQKLERASLATLVGLLPHYVAYYLLNSPLLTETIAEWIMARTPSRYALWILDSMGAWAKPFAVTGGLATLGGAVCAAALLPKRWMAPVAALASALLYAWLFDYHSLPGQMSFWIPAIAFLLWPSKEASADLAQPQRRQAFAMLAGTAVVAVEAYVRDAALARHATVARDLIAFAPPVEGFAAGLVRKAVTQVGTFYVMSKNSVDPALDPTRWRLNITAGDRTIRSIGYADLLKMPHVSEYVTLRCISNTLQSDLMGTALWTGVRFQQLLDPSELDPSFLEAAVIGVDGHGDSFDPRYLWSDDVMLAVAMNGKTLTRVHGFPVRLIVPRYYGFKNVKWIGEIALVHQPYIGTWPKLGYTKEPVVHTASHIDRIVRDPQALKIGGVSFAGDRGIQAVEVRADNGPWQRAQLERPLSRFTWTRWSVDLPTASATRIEARAQDGRGRWQESEEGPLFPDGVKGPTIRRIS